MNRRFEWITVTEPEYRHIRLVVYPQGRVICINKAADEDAKIILLMLRPDDEQK